MSLTVQSSIIVKNLRIHLCKFMQKVSFYKKILESRGICNILRFWDFNTISGPFYNSFVLYYVHIGKALENVFITSLVDSR